MNRTSSHYVGNATKEWIIPPIEINISNGQRLILLVNTESLTKERLYIRNESVIYKLTATRIYEI